MHFKEIIKGYGAIFFALLTFLAIAGVCTAAGLLVAYPLWKLATMNTSLYTIISISLFSFAIIYFLVKKIIKAYKKSPLRLFLSFLRKLTIIGGLFLCCNLFLTFQKIPALIVLIIVFVLYGFLAFGLPQITNSNNEK